MDRSDIIVAVIVGIVALAAIAGVIWLAFVGREALQIGNKLVNAGIILWIADHLISAILCIIVFSVVLYGVILYLMHFGVK